MRSKRPVIGITTSSNTVFLMWLALSLSTILGGGKPKRITPNNQNNYAQCQGFIISGGPDINPALYGHKNTDCINLDNERDALEQGVIRYALQTEKPLLGICRGAQLINIILGGNLYQDAKNFFQEFVPVNSILGKIFYRKKIKITGNTYLSEIYMGSENLYVNSWHHQAIAELGTGLHIAAKDEYGMPQAIERVIAGYSVVLGVQWHPELLLYSPMHRRLFKSLVLSAIQQE